MFFLCTKLFTVVMLIKNMTVEVVFRLYTGIRMIKNNKEIEEKRRQW